MFINDPEKLRIPLSLASPLEYENHQLKATVDIRLFVMFLIWPWFNYFKLASLTSSLTLPPYQHRRKDQSFIIIQEHMWLGWLFPGGKLLQYSSSPSTNARHYCHHHSTCQKDAGGAQQNSKPNHSKRSKWARFKEHAAFREAERN